MRKLFLASAPLLTLAVASPAFSQGATMSPPAPNSGVNMPQSPNSVPEGARTMAPGTTGTQRMGTVGTTEEGTMHRRRHRRHRMRNPGRAQQQTVPTPQSQ